MVIVFEMILFQKCFGLFLLFVLLVGFLPRLIKDMSDVLYSEVNLFCRIFSCYFDFVTIGFQKIDVFFRFN